MAYFDRLRRMSGAGPRASRPARAVKAPPPAAEALELHEVREVGSNVGRAAPRAAPRPLKPPAAAYEPIDRGEASREERMPQAGVRENGVSGFFEPVPELAPAGEAGVSSVETPAFLEADSGHAEEPVAETAIEPERLAAPVVVDGITEERSRARRDVGVQEADGARGASAARRPPRPEDPPSEAPGATRSKAEDPVERFRESMIRVREWMTASTPSETPVELTEPIEPARAASAPAIPVALAAPAALAPEPVPPVARERRPSLAAPPPPVDVSIGAIQVSVQEPAATDRPPAAAREARPRSVFSPSRYYVRD